MYYKSMPPYGGVDHEELEIMKNVEYRRVSYHGLYRFCVDCDKLC